MWRTRKAALLLLLLAAVLVLGISGWRWLFPAKVAPAPAKATRAAPPPSPSALTDPLFPSRPAALDRARAELDSNWVKAAPNAKFQYSRPASERDGVEPCGAPLPKAANEVLSLSRGYLFTSGQGLLDRAGRFDLIFHLHGESPVRRELIESGQPFALYTLTLPVNASYAPLFAGSGLFEQLLAEITSSISSRYGVAAQLGHVTLSAWSAGFEGVRSILYQPEAARVEALLLIDGFHAPRTPNGLATQLEPFVRFARRAMRGETWFALTHSSIRTQGFTSTTESAHYLVNELGGKPTAVSRDDGFGLELVETFSSGALFVRGYAGNDKADHCAQLFLLRSLFTALNRHFHPH